MSVDACAESARLERLVVADFDMPSRASPTTGNDMTPNAVVSVDAMAPLEAPKCPGEPAGNGYHFVGRGFQDYGYSYGYNTLGNLADGGPYYDASAWTGISMWVRKGSGPSASVVFASVGDRYTVPPGGSLFSADEEGLLLFGADCPMDQPAGVGCYCNYNAVDVNGDDAPDPLGSQCDRFGVGIGMSTSWRFFKVPFDRMRQRAYGRPSQLSLPDADIFAIDIALDGEDWDFWLDDLAFYREPAADAVGGP